MFHHGLKEVFVRDIYKNVKLKSMVFEHFWCVKRWNGHLLGYYPYRKAHLSIRFNEKKASVFNQCKYTIKTNNVPAFSVISLHYHDKCGTKPAIIERENIWTIPNILCLCRIGITPYLGHLILCSDFSQAFYVMVLAGVTDFLDGLIARTWYTQSSKLGSFLDPMADKILIITLFSTMTYSELIPAVLTILIISRDITLAAAAFYIRYLSLPPPRTLSRYFDASHATAQLAPTLISKLNTVVQLGTVATTLTAYAFDFSEHSLLPCLWFITAGTTIASAVSYIISKNTYKILKKPSPRKTT